MATRTSSSTLYDNVNTEAVGGTSFPPVIPPEHPFRTLVLCFDGTGDQFDDDNSNIIQFLATLKRNDPSKQMVYYQSGIGTESSSLSPVTSIVSKALDMAIAWSLDTQVMEGYKFLMQNYQAGDRVCIFGFSRGAYTARGLAGMIHKVGVLPTGNTQQIPFAYAMFSRDDAYGDEQSAKFKAAYAIDIDIEFVGVWDTVASVGIFPRYLPFTSSNSIIKTFRHAVSLDEHRVKFQANLYHQAPDHSHSTHAHNNTKCHVDPIHQGFSTDKDKMTQFEKVYAKMRTTRTDREEVWFAGAHCDVGGGSVKNGNRFSLSRIPLRWMVRECFKTNSGIMFSSEGLKKLGMDPTGLIDLSTFAYPVDNHTGLMKPRPASVSHMDPSLIPAPLCHCFTTNKDAMFIRTIEEDTAAFKLLEDHPLFSTEEEEELHDALSPAFDQLELRFIWWILEWIPLNSGRSKKDTSHQMNFGRPRKVPHTHWIDSQEGKIKVHRSVKLRMMAKLKEGRNQGKEYKPKLHLDWNLDTSNVVWVD